MNPPNKNFIASKNYKGLVNACVPPKRNTKEKQIHKDFHYTIAQVNIVNQMTQMYRENTLSMSVDNKNKVEVGIPATSQQTNICSFHIPYSILFSCINHLLTWTLVNSNIRYFEPFLSFFSDNSFGQLEHFTLTSCVSICSSIKMVNVYINVSAK